MCSVQVLWKLGKRLESRNVGTHKHTECPPPQKTPAQVCKKFQKCFAEPAPFNECGTNYGIMISIDCTSSPVPDPWLNTLHSLISQNTKNRFIHAQRDQRTEQGGWPPHVTLENVRTVHSNKTSRDVLGSLPFVSSFCNTMSVLTIPIKHSFRLCCKQVVRDTWFSNMTGWKLDY